MILFTFLKQRQAELEAARLAKEKEEEEVRQQALLAKKEKDIQKKAIKKERQKLRNSCKVCQASGAAALKSTRAPDEVEVFTLSPCTNTKTHFILKYRFGALLFLFGYYFLRQGLIFYYIYFLCVCVGIHERWPTCGDLSVLSWTTLLLEIELSCQAWGQVLQLQSCFTSLIESLL